MGDFQFLEIAPLLATGSILQEEEEEVRWGRRKRKRKRRQRCQLAVML